MAKQAKHVELDIPDRVITKAVRDVLDRYANIESARGTFMSAARIERKAMTEVYQSLAARGIPHRVAKTEIKIIQLIDKINSLMAELELEDRKMVAKMARAQEDNRQLSLFGDDLMPPKKSRAKKPPKADLETTEAAGVA
jgi:hypothetical protein